MCRLMKYTCRVAADGQSLYTVRRTWLSHLTLLNTMMRFPVYGRSMMIRRRWRTPCAMADAARHLRLSKIARKDGKADG